MVDMGYNFLPISDILIFFFTTNIPMSMSNFVLLQDEHEYEHDLEHKLKHECEHDPESEH